MPDKRIIDYNEAETLESDDYLIVDGTTNGTRKIKPNQLQVATDKTLSIENSPADAKKVGDEITDIKADLSESISDLKDNLWPITQINDSVVNFTMPKRKTPFIKIATRIVPEQTGSGDPSYDNPRPVTLYTGCVFNHSGSDISNPQSIAVNWEDEENSLYGGTIDLITGELTVEWSGFWITEPIAVYSKGGTFPGFTWCIYKKSVDSKYYGINTAAYGDENGYFNVGVWKAVSSAGVRANFSNGAFYVAAITSDYDLNTVAGRQEHMANLVERFGGLQVVYKLAIPYKVQLSPHSLQTLVGENNVWTNVGDVDVTYYNDVISEFNRLHNLEDDSLYSIGKHIDVSWKSGYIETNKSPGETISINTVKVSSNIQYTVLPVTSGELYTLSLVGGVSARAWCITDAEYTVISASPVKYKAENKEIIIPDDGAFLILHNDFVVNTTIPKITKGKILENRIYEINNKLSTILGNEYILVKKDTSRWTNPSPAYNYIRMSDFVDDGVILVSATSKTNILRAALYDLKDGVFKGYWDERSEDFVSSSEKVEQSFIEITKIRERFPNYQVVVECSGTKDPEYPSENIDVYYVPYEYRNGTRKNYIKQPLNSGDWESKQISRVNGNSTNSLEWLSTMNYIPDYWSRIQGSRMQLIAFDNAGTCIGGMTYTGIVNGSATEMSDIDLDKIRRFFPDYNFKINIYSQSMNLSEVGSLIIDKDKMDAKNHNRMCYMIPTRFSRTNIYGADIPVDEGMVKASISGQGFCTDGTHIYAGILKDNYVVVKKIDTDGTLIDEKNLGNMGHANQFTYDPNNDRILVAGGTSVIYTFNPETLEIGESFQIDNIISAINAKYPGGAMSQIWNIAHYPSENVFLIGSGTTFAIVNQDFSQVLKVIRMNIGNGKRQFIYPKDEYIVNAFAEGAYHLSATDWNGRIITTFNTQRTYAQVIYAELEGICEINGILYAYWNRSGGAHVTVTKENIDGYTIVPVAEVQKKFDYGC